MTTCAKLVEARSAIVATHKALRVAQKQIGLDAVNFGGLVTKIAGVPDEGPSGRHLFAVDAASRQAA